MAESLEKLFLTKVSEMPQEEIEIAGVTKGCHGGRQELGTVFTPFFICPVLSIKLLNLLYMFMLKSTHCTVPNRPPIVFSVIIYQLLFRLIHFFLYKSRRMSSLTT